MTRRPAARSFLLLTALVAGGALVPGPATSQDTPASAGPVGKITDREGTGARRGLGDLRWSPADARTPVLPGDWLKTGARGANALDVALDGGARLVLGPGALVEVLAADRLRLHAGEVAFTPAEGKTLVVEAGPGVAPRDVTARTVLRAGRAGLEPLAQAPRWLTGYEDRAPTEAVGALLATVDGRDVPLTLGYHKVDVDIRDQVARTEIEECFVNHTPQVLEGVFYFPLPADASISGFSMWIGDEQVHGEIVEKQRARAIYETILREKRDPGLLEWAGGSLFKARVYPITGEKRIKISYTQVLPQTIGEGGAAEVVYHHALASEHLRLHPLKELQVTVTVSSQRRILGVTVPTHPARVQATEHAARVEVAQQEVAPDRDLEVRIRTQRPAAGMTLASHRRGDDGYFMVLLDAPVLAKATKKAPIDVLVLCDTSGSVSGPARDAQVQFVAALLEALGPDDTFDLAVFDADLRWASGRPTKADPATREAALGLLAGRAPLGWTDLDRAIAAAAERAGPSTHVIYVGDGAVTTGDADAAAFARRVPSLYRAQGRFHAVVPGSTREAAALKAIAALGGGSVRAVGSDPARTAFDLLAEVTSPRVRDVKLSFEGIPVAAVYPEVLPDLAVGAQHVIVGRWDPTTAPRDGLKGTLRLTGSVEHADLQPGMTTKVNFTHEVALGDAPTPREDDASFIPRLWARAHLDHLLAQGATAEIKQRVIALSEDFQLVTPYTSFLVLETDADRERFQVKKRTRMRDGEEFFARGRDDAEHALRRQAALQARAWRRAMRARALEALADMNRGLTQRLGTIDGPTAVGYGGQRAVFLRATARRETAAPFLAAKDMPAGAAAPTESLAFDAEEAGEPLADDVDATGGEDLGEAGDAVEDPLELDARGPAPASVPAPVAQRALERQAFAEEGRFDKARARHAGISAAEPTLGFADDERSSARSDPFDALLPALPGPPGDAPAIAWPKALTDALADVDLRARVTLAHLRVRTSVQRPDARGRLQARGDALWLLSRDRWATASLHRDGEDLRLDWLAHAGAGGALQRGALTAAWTLGRARPAAASDARGWTSPWPYWTLEDFAPYAAWTLTTAPAADGAVELTLTRPDDPAHRVVVIVDRARRVVRSARGERGEAITWSFAYDVAEVGGAWWPTAVRRFDGDRLVEKTKIAVDVLAPAAFEQALAEALSIRARALLLGPAPASLRAARAAVREGQASLEERWAVLGSLAGAQRWDAARPHLDAVLAAAKDRPAAVAIEATALQHGRRLEELRVLLGRTAEELARSARPADMAAATALLGWASSLAEGAERLDLVRALEPVVERHAGLTDARFAFELARAQALEAVGQPDEALAALRAVVAREPERFAAHQQLAWWLANHDDPEAAVAHLDEALAKHGPWPEHERQALVQQAHSALWSGQRLDALVERFERLEREDAAASAQVIDTYLAALVMVDRPDAAWARVKAWTDLTGGLPLEGLARARFDAAVRHALGHGLGLWSNTIEPERAQHLADVVRALAAADPARHPAALPLAQQIVQDWRWNQSPAGVAAVKQLLGRLRAEASTLPPASAVALFHLLRHAGPAAGAEPKVWEELLDVFEARRQALAASDRQGASALDQVILSFGDPARRLRRLRELHAGAMGEGVRPARAQLLQALLQQPWTAELREEALSLLVGLAPASQDEGAREAELTQQVGLLHQVLDWTTHARARAEVAARPDHGQLDRRRLAAATDEALRAARVEALELLGALGPKAPALTSWLALERAWLQVKLGRDRDAARAACAALVDARLAAEPAFGDAVVLARAVATLLYLVATDELEAAPKHGAALAAQVERALEKQDARLDWRQVKLTLLLLRDDLAGLETALRAWFDAADDDEATRWGVPLSHVLAERDRVQDAAQVLERVEALDEASHHDLQRLALLYTVLDRPADARAARARAWALVDEWQLSSSLQQDARRVSRTGDGVPEALDPEAPIKVVALLRKARSPEQHVWTVLSLYQTTRDFRLLEGLAEGVLGHSAQRVYALLQGVRGLTDSLQEEATLDRLRAAVVALRARPDTTAVDQRALWLLELLATRGAAAQRQGAGPHLEAAARALREAFALAERREGAWAPGEPALYAGLLAHQGALPGPLGDEQLRQLQALVALARDADERLTLAAHLAAAQWSHGRRDDAIRSLSGALEAARDDARLAPRHHQHLSTLASFLQGVGRFVDAEALFERELAAGHATGPARALRLGLHEVWRVALASRAATKLGQGAALYRGARDALLRDLGERTHESHASGLIQALAQLWQTAAQQRVPGVGDDVTRFAFGELPHVLRAYQHREASSMVGAVVDALARHASAMVALDCLVQQAESEPRWLGLRRADAWSRHGWRFGQLLEAAQGELPDALSQRLLELVKRELRRDLLLGRQGAAICWARRSSQFWAAQLDAFAQVAREVLAERREVEVTVVHVARYLHDAIERHDDGITALAEAERRGVLGWQSRLLLVTWLHQAERFADALPLVEQLAQERPEELGARCLLITTLFRLDQDERVTRALADAEGYVRETKAWNEGAAATLGSLCVQVERPQEAARHLEEAIALHTRSRRARGVGGGTLSTYYQQLSQARLQLGDTPGAVDAACGAVVAWGPRSNQRAQALGNLAHVLRAAPDLDAFVARFEQEVARTGLDNPTLRRALGQVYREQRRFEQAERHLRLALDAQPSDLEVHRELVDVLDALERDADAADQLQALALAAGHDVGLYVELGRRRATLGQPDEAERAWTNAVELVPEEAEGHTALAQIREEQGRFTDAVERWRQVVRVRTDEPAGWLGVARGLLRAGEKAEAAKVAREVLGRDWEERFGDVHGQARRLLEAASR